MKLVSRLETLRRSKVTPPLPPNPAPHIVDWLTEIGLSEAAGMGAVPLSWREINAWQEATGVRLSTWEARTIRRLSADYLRESRLAESEAAVPPWRASMTEAAKAAEVAALDMILG